MLGLGRLRNDRYRYGCRKSLFEIAPKSVPNAEEGIGRTSTHGNFDTVLERMPEGSKISRHDRQQAESEAQDYAAPAPL